MVSYSPFIVRSVRIVRRGKTLCHTMMKKIPFLNGSFGACIAPYKVKLKYLRIPQWISKLFATN